MTALRFSLRRAQLVGRGSPPARGAIPDLRRLPPDSFAGGYLSAAASA
jgi:hypothetical protein